VAQPNTIVLALDNIDLHKLNLRNTRVYATMLLNLSREIKAAACARRTSISRFPCFHPRAIAASGCSRRIEG